MPNLHLPMYECICENGLFKEEEKKLQDKEYIENRTDVIAKKKIKGKIKKSDF